MRERNGKGILSRRGKGQWTSGTVKMSLMSATPAAVSETPDYTPSHRPDYDKRQRAADGNWPAVTTYETVLAVRAILRDPEHAQAYYGREPVHLLTGLLECGVCGHRTFMWDKGSGSMPDRYMCESANKKPGEPGTGYCVMHRAAMLDGEITRLFLAVAAWPGVAAAFTRPGEDIDALKAERQILIKQREDASDAYTGGTVSLAWAQRTDQKLTAKIEALTGRITAAMPAAAGLVLTGIAAGDDPESVWERATVAERRQALRLVFGHITILPRRRGRPKGIPSKAPWPMDWSRIRIGWTPAVWGAAGDQPLADGGYIDNSALRELLLSIPAEALPGYVTVSASSGAVTKWDQGAQLALPMGTALQPALLRTGPGSTAG
jgi:hypothetical protein